MTHDTRTAAEVGERIESLLSGLMEVSPLVADRAEELVALLVGMYGDALDRMAARIDEATLRELARDPVIAGILILHDLHPDDVRTRVEAALDRVRPYLGSHAGGVELLDVGDDGVVRVRLEGSCDGCPASRVTVETAIEGAVFESAPDIVAVTVEGITPADDHGQLLQIGRKPQPGKPRWVPVTDTVPPAGVLEMRTLGDFDIVIVVTDDGVHAHRGDCPVCGAAVNDGSLSGSILACPGCGRRFDLADAGRCMDGEAFLDPIPVLQEAGTIKLALREAIVDPLPGVEEEVPA